MKHQQATGGRSMDEWDITHCGLRPLSAGEIKEFWKCYIAHRGDVLIEHGSLYSRWRKVADHLVISLFLTNRSVGLFLRGPRGERFRTTVQRLSMHEPKLGRELGASLCDFDGCCYLSRLPLAVIDRPNWPKGYAWLEEREECYHRVLGEIVVRGESADR